MPIPLPRPTPECSCTNAGRCVARAYPSAMATATVSCSASTYPNPGTCSAASRKPCSTVPGLPNIQSNRSARNCSKITSLPGLAVIVNSPPRRDRTSCRTPGRARSPAVPAQSGLEGLHELLATEERVRSGPCGDERVVHDHRRLLADVAVVAAVRGGGVALDVLLRVRGRGPASMSARGTRTLTVSRLLSLSSGP